MKYNNPGYNRLLVGDLYYWELDQNEYFEMKKNHPITRKQSMSEPEFWGINSDDISEDIED